MPRNTLIRSHIHAYHIVNRVNNREKFQLPLDQVWELFCTELWHIGIMRGLKVHAFVLMPNHYHLLASSPYSDLDQIMSEWTSPLAKEYNYQSDRSGHLFGQRYHWSLISDPMYFAYATKYIYRNPCKAGLVESAGDYPYSTLAGILGNAPLPIALSWPLQQIDRIFLPDDPGALEEWVKEPFRETEEGAVRRANRKKVFGFSERDQAHMRRFFHVDQERFNLDSGLGLEAANSESLILPKVELRPGISGNVGL